MAESFVFYETWEEQLGCLDSVTRVQFLEAIIKYGLREEEPDFTGLARALWVGIKNDMDNAKARRIKNMENGKRGGIQKALNADTKKEQEQVDEPLASPSECLATPSDPLANPSQPYLDVDGDVDVDGNVDGNSIGAKAPEPSGSSPTKSTRFVKPTVAEVQAYCDERKNNIDPRYFCDYYEVRGWKVGGKTPMKDWQAAVRTWEQNGLSTTRKYNAREPPIEQVDRNFDVDAMAALFNGR